MSSSPRQLGLYPRLEVGLDPSSDDRTTTQRISAAMVLRAERFSRQYPEALALAARLTAAIRRRTSGLGVAASGNHTPDQWARMCRGEGRSLKVDDLARLCISSRPEALRAADDVIEILAAARGKRVVPEHDLAAQVLEDLATAADYAASLVEKIRSLGVRSAVTR